MVTLHLTQVEFGLSLNGAGLMVKHQVVQMTWISRNMGVYCTRMFRVNIWVIGLTVVEPRSVFYDAGSIIIHQVIYTTWFGSAVCIAFNLG